MQNVRLGESQLGIKTARRNINNLRYGDDITLTEESEEPLYERVKEESEKADSKLNTQKLRSWHPVPSLHGTEMMKKWKQ